MRPANCPAAHEGPSDRHTRGWVYRTLVSKQTLAGVLFSFESWLQARCFVSACYQPLYSRLYIGVVQLYGIYIYIYIYRAGRPRALYGWALHDCLVIRMADVRWREEAPTSPLARYSKRSSMRWSVELDVVSMGCCVEWWPRTTWDWVKSKACAHSGGRGGDSTSSSGRFGKLFFDIHTRSSCCR